MNKVLIAVLKNKKDLEILLKEKWYRIPKKYAPKREYDIIAFYQPAKFKGNGKRIKYYGVVRSKRLCKRKELINDGIDPEKIYYKVTFLRIVQLEHPIINENKLRISFKYTNFGKLYSSKNLGELFDIPDIEGKIEGVLKALKLDYKREYIVKTKESKIYRLDFCVFINDVKIDIECDGEKWHALKQQKMIDNKRDHDLEKMGFKVLRLKEKEIIKGDGVSLISLMIKKI
ncbi:DUF559 domain-containing protein [bacterium]|nr:DUF559 domain-containing protein [bacterium]